MNYFNILFCTGFIIFGALLQEGNRKGERVRHGNAGFENCLFTVSSKASLAAETISERRSGTRVPHRPVGDSFGICWRLETRRK